MTNNVDKDPIPEAAIARMVEADRKIFTARQDILANIEISLLSESIQYPSKSTMDALNRPFESIRPLFIMWLDGTFRWAKMAGTYEYAKTFEWSLDMYRDSITQESKPYKSLKASNYTVLNLFEWFIADEWKCSHSRASQELSKLFHRLDVLFYRSKLTGVSAISKKKVFKDRLIFALTQDIHARFGSSIDAA